MNEGGGEQVEQILISIIIATYNAGEHLQACLDSIISQAEKRIDIIIVDGMSQDNTISILQSFGHKRLNWISEPDKGIYDALNKGIHIAKGKWIYFLGADDRLLPAFSDMAAKLQEDNAVYYGDTEPFYYGDNKPGYELLVGEFSNYRLAKYCMNHQTIIYPATAFGTYQYSLKYKVFADYALNLQLWGDRHFKKIYYPIIIARYNMTGFSSTIDDRLFKKDKPALIRKSMGWLIYARFIFKRFRKRNKGETDFD